MTDGLCLIGPTTEDYWRMAEANFEGHVLSCDQCRHGGIRGRCPIGNELDWDRQTAFRLASARPIYDCAPSLRNA